jgi:hypothetical protein
MDEETKTEEKIKPTSNNSSTIGTISFIIIALFWWWLNYEPVNPQLFKVPLDINTNLSGQDFSKNPFERKEDDREYYIEIIKGLSFGGEEYHGCVFDYYMEKVGVSGFIEDAIEIDKTGELTPLMDDAAEACIKYADETMYEMKDEYYRWLEIKGYDEPSFENYEEFIDAK